MGCCLSSPVPSNSPYPQNGPTPSSSSRRITSPPSIPRPSTTGSSMPAQPRSPTSATPANLRHHKNKPLKSHVWTTKDGERQWTREAIDKERAEFFDTRVTGRQEVWQSLHAALGFLWDIVWHVEGEGGEAVVASANHGFKNAQAVLTAAGITVPSGDLTKEVYDEWGTLYVLPEWVVSDPQNLRVAVEGEGIGSERERGESEGSQETTESAKLRRREDKGKAVVPREEEMLKVRVRLSDGRADVIIKIGKEESVRLLQRKIREVNNLPPEQKIKIIYMGRHLRESTSLLAEGWSEAHVINAFLTNEIAPDPAPRGRPLPSKSSLLARNNIPDY